MKRGFVVTVSLGAGAAALAALASSRTWATATATSPARRTVTASGSDVAPLALALALVALAAWGTVLVLRRRGRRAVSVLGLLASAGVVATVLTTVDTAADVARRTLAAGTAVHTDTTGWPAAAAAASAVSLLCFGTALLKAGGWPEMSGRYDAPAGNAAQPTPAGDDLWKALDEGRDPTV